MLSHRFMLTAYIIQRYKKNKYCQVCHTGTVFWLMFFLYCLLNHLQIKRIMKNSYAAREVISLSLFGVIN
nr:MAG TPA: cytochrome c2 [Caudoviricetes sp.]